jgi:hypothetical protein
MFAYFALQNEISSILRRPYLNFKSELDEFQAIIYQLPNEKSRKRMGL